MFIRYKEYVMGRVTDKYLDQMTYGFSHTNAVVNIAPYLNEIMRLLLKHDEYLENIWHCKRTS